MRPDRPRPAAEEAAERRLGGVDALLRCKGRVAPAKPGCSAAWQRASFGTRRSQVQILPSRPSGRPRADWAFSLLLLILGQGALVALGPLSRVGDPGAGTAGPGGLALLAPDSVGYLAASATWGDVAAAPWPRWGYLVILRLGHLLGDAPAVAVTIQVLTTVAVGGIDDPHLEDTVIPAPDVLAPAASGESDAALHLGLVHAPYVAALDALSDAGHDLLLAGHTHGGQVRLPGVGALTANCDLPLSQARGSSRWRDRWLHVSPGLGHSKYTPVRFACRPEATLLELRG